MIRHPLLVALAVAGSLAALAPAEAAGSFAVSRPPSVLTTDQQLASYDTSGTRSPGFFSFLAHPNRPAAGGGFGGFQSRSINPAFLPLDGAGGAAICKSHVLMRFLDDAAEPGICETWAVGDNVNDIGLLLQTGKRPPEKRVPILRKVSTAHGPFWRYP